jgi:hypothetical protein
VQEDIVAFEPELSASSSESEADAPFRRTRRVDPLARVAASQHADSAELMEAQGVLAATDIDFIGTMFPVTQLQQLLGLKSETCTTAAFHKAENEAVLASPAHAAFVTIIAAPAAVLVPQRAANRVFAAFQSHFPYVRWAATHTLAVTYAWIPDCAAGCTGSCEQWASPSFCADVIYT